MIYFLPTFVLIALAGVMAGLLLPLNIALVAAVLCIAVIAVIATNKHHGEGGPGMAIICMFIGFFAIPMAASGVIKYFNP